MEALGSVLLKLLESSINNYCNPPRAKLLGNAAQLPLLKKEASKGTFAPLLLPFHLIPSNWRGTMGESTYYVFYWVSINGDHTDGGCPLVVLLVNVLIQDWVVNKPR